MGERVDIEELRRLAANVAEHMSDDRADMIDLAADEIARLREERRWVSVGERLPADNVAVLCCGDGIGAEMVWRENGQWHLSWVGTPISDSTYTHWMPLPQGPEGDGNG